MGCVTVEPVKIECLDVVGTRMLFFFFSSRRRHTRCLSDWSSDVCSSDLSAHAAARQLVAAQIWNSPEHRALQVDTYYNEVLGRAADPAGKQAWINALTNGQIGRASCRERV